MEILTLKGKMETQKPWSGLELIAEERIRQIEEEGWTPDHDAEHTDEELAKAGCYYGWPRKEIQLDFSLDCVFDSVKMNIPTTALYPASWHPAYAKKAQKTG